MLIACIYGRVKKLIITGRITDEVTQVQAFDTLSNVTWDKVKRYLILEWTNDLADPYVIKRPTEKNNHLWV